MAKRIDPRTLPILTSTFYPPPYDRPCRARAALGEAAGLTQFGVHLARLAPGVWSSKPNWHAGEDEFIYVLEGEVMLVTNGGEEVLKTGDCADFKAGEEDGHHLLNRSEQDALLLEIGSRSPAGICSYPISTWWRPPTASPPSIPIVAARPMAA